MIVRELISIQTIINYHARGQTRKTIHNYHYNFEHVQSEW